ncbi:type II secretion system F family protein [Vibrio aquaticus]|uniref:Type II secretion system F family protein n=1 Tax=Vibrio aquaticus TaxID=2496559 RepID=A0A3S0MH39_9VIBR|nr:type II secretion system F family protein [Vibrio aquaticus]RTZ14462.1 type II secretion system F family protein [Vibrio aquaticus]
MSDHYSSTDLELFLAWSGIAFGLFIIVYWLIVKIQHRRRIAALAKHNQFVASKKATKAELSSWLQPVTSILSTSEDEVAVRFSNAGFKNTRYSHLFMPIKYGALVLGELAIGGAFYFFDGKTNHWIAAAGAWAMLAIAGPDIILDSMAKARQRRISKQMPYLIDLMAICVQTGMTIEASMKYLAIEIQGFNKELAEMLDKTNQRARIIGMEKALEELYQKVPSSEMRSFVMTLSQSIQHGSSIYSMLTTLAGDIREVQMLELEEEIGKLAAKMSIPLIVFILIPIVFVIAAPGVMRLMLNV